MNAPEKLAPARARLRRATDAVHQALHDAAPFAAIADGSMSREGYGALLHFLHRYHSAVQPLCRGGAHALAAPELAAAHAARLAALVEDLAWLDQTPEAAVATEPAPDDDFCIGALYTAQGSCLGGKVIHRQLAGLLPGSAGRRFFQGTATDGRDWQALCAGLETRVRDLDRLEQGALHAFELFRVMLPKWNLPLSRAVAISLPGPV